MQASYPETENFIDALDFEKCGLTPMDFVKKHLKSHFEKSLLQLSKQIMLNMQST